MNAEKKHKRRFTRIGAVLVICCLTSLFLIVLSCNIMSEEDDPEGFSVALFFAQFFPEILAVQDGNSEFILLDIEKMKRRSA